jgi:NADH-quinone oxidoreductase subunit H
MAFLEFLKDPFVNIGQWFHGLLVNFGLPDVWVQIISLVAGAFVLALVPLASMFFLIWYERKIVARIGDRLGPNNSGAYGGPYGLFQVFADAIKMFVKEDFVPSFAHRRLHTFAPFLAMFAALVTFAVIPFGPQFQAFGHTIKLQVADLNVGFLYIFALSPLGVYAIAMGSWASNNKYAQFGGIRGIAQLISYDVTLGLSLMGLVMVFGTVQLDQMVVQQGQYWLHGWIPKWGVFLQPLGLLLFFPAAFAETKRNPFDLPEGESEIIGFNLEYSGLKFGLFMMSEFIETLVFAAMLTTLFFGGWQVPWLAADGFHFPWGTQIPLSTTLVVILQVLSFIIKVVFFCWFLQLVRWTLPRFRYDQLMRLTWKQLLPLAVLNVVLTALVLLYL